MTARRRRPVRRGLDLGWFELCLNVRNLPRSVRFYRKLGFRKVGGVVKKGWAILDNGQTRVSLFRGHITTNLLNFRGGDVESNVARIERSGIPVRWTGRPRGHGAGSARFKDPDGNVIFLDTAPFERVLWAKGRRAGDRR